MTIHFHNPPFVKEDTHLTVCLQGKDMTKNQYVEIRVLANALTLRCGAEGITNNELLRAFGACRAKIEAAALRKYETGDFQDGDVSAIVWLGLDDL